MSELLVHHRRLVGIARGWALKNISGWTDDNHRDLLYRYGATAIDGRISASTLNLPQLASVLDDYERRGWTRERKIFHRGQSVRTVPPRIAHMVRLWGRLGQSGKVAKATRPALLAFCARQVRRSVSDLDSLSPPECQSVTEALKSWLQR